MDIEQFMSKTTTGAVAPTLETKILKIIVKKPGVTIGVVFNQIRDVERSLIVSELQKLTNSGKIIAMPRDSAHKQKPTILFFPSDQDCKS